MNNTSDNGMDRRDFLKTATATTAAAATLGPMAMNAGAKQDIPKKRPNILFIFSDEHRWQSLPFTEMPSVIAPNMQKLADQGMRFDNCYSTSPICVPYRGMLMTGLYPHQSEIISNNYFENTDIIGVDAPTIAHTFKAAGYKTGYVGKWHLHNKTVYDAGFDYFKHWLFGDEHWETEVRDVPSREEFKKVKGYNAIGMTDQTIDFLRENADSDQPFMTMLSINPPHWRWDDAPQEFVDMYPEDIEYRPNVKLDRYKDGKELLYYRHYHAHITAVDRELGRMMDELDKLGIADDTIVIYTSDHGSSFGSQGVGSKGNPFDEAIRVPFIVRWPENIEAGSIADNVMGTPDIHTTLLGLAGIEQPDNLPGYDFTPVMLGADGPDPEGTFILVNNFARNYFRTVTDPDNQAPYFTPYRGIRTKQYTFAVYEYGDWILFDNINDPYQLKNLVDDPAYAEVKQELRSELIKLLAMYEDPYIPEQWVKLSLPDRIAKQNEIYSIRFNRRKCVNYKEAKLKPFLEQATTTEQKKQLRALADEVFSEDFFGEYLAYDAAINGRRKFSKVPIEELQAKLDAYEGPYVEKFDAKAKGILK